MAPYCGFDYRVEDGAGTVTFARPEVLNSLTLEAYADLERLAPECHSDDSVRVLALTGTGKAVCMTEGRKQFDWAFTEKRPPRFTGR